MNLTDLQSKSVAELRDIYNSLADKHLKKFENRVEAEKRTAEKLKEAGQWEGNLPGKSAAKKAAAKAAKLAAKPEKAAKPAKAAKAPKAEGTPRGAPKKNAIYIALELPEGARMNAESARTIVYNRLVEAGKKGLDRETLDREFAGNEAINVSSSVSYLIKVGYVEAKEA